MSRPARLVLFLAVCLAASVPAALPAAEQGKATADRKAVTIGSIHPRPTKHFKIMQPLADYLARRLRGSGIERGRVVVAANVQAMADYLKREVVDLYLDSPFPTLLAAERAGSRPVLRRWKGGSPEYHTVFLVRRDSPIRALRDLRGKMLAFEDPGSTSAYFLPKAYLLKHGFILEEKQHATDYVAPNSIGYVFAVAQSNLLLWMVREKVEIVAVSNQNWERNEHLRRELRIVARTWAVPRHVVSFGAHVPGPVAARLREVLVAMDEEPEGRRVLEHLERTDRFDEFPQGPEAGLKGVKELMSFVRRELGAL